MEYANIDLEKTRPLVEKWLGGLPTIARTDRWTDPGVGFPGGIHRLDIPIGKEPKANVRIAWGGLTDWSRDAATDAAVLTEVLDLRLRDVLREDMSGVRILQRALAEWP